MGTDLDASPWDVPAGAEQTGCREGPIFLATPWASIGAALLAINGISAGLYVRERTGRGQWFETSLVQAAIMANAMGWQRVERTHPSYRLWYFDRRAPKGIFQAADGRWLHQWAPIDHEFIRANALDRRAARSSRRYGRRRWTTSRLVRSQAEAHPETAARHRHPPVRRLDAHLLGRRPRRPADPLARGGAARRAAATGGRDRRGRRPAARPDPPGRPRLRARRGRRTRRSGRARRPSRRRRPCRLRGRRGPTDNGGADAAAGSADRRARARLRPRHRRPVRPAAAGRPRRHRDQGDDARLRPHRRHLRRLEPRQAGARARPQASPGLETSPGA